jgi:glycosyltransferase involved in cell wall biosynthesis
MRQTMEEVGPGPAAVISDVDSKSEIDSKLEVSVVMPCLNEADTLEACVTKAQRVLRKHGIKGEVIVADNGSTDGSQAIAIRMGARLVHVEPKGYGNALMGGIAAARGKFVIMGDADDSYDFLQLSRFVEKLREGFDLVQGCRLPAGGGTVQPGAMPFLHRWWGNPMFSIMTRWMFHAPIHDVYCGMRGFAKELYDRLDQRCTGMEFATEMIIKASLFGADIAEVPITLHPDGRKSHAPHLKTFRDGWRTLRFFLMYSPLGFS